MSFRPLTHFSFLMVNYERCLTFYTLKFGCKTWEINFKIIKNEKFINNNKYLFLFYYQSVLPGDKVICFFKFRIIICEPLLENKINF